MGILIVSADAGAAGALAAELEGRGEGVTRVTSAGAARDSARAAPPLVLVVDRAIPEADGLAEALRAEAPWLRVYTLEDAPGAAPTAVGKPIDPHELAERLSRARELAELERRRHVVELRAEELAALVEVSLESILGIAADGTIRSWNRGAASLYGYTAAEAIGMPIDALETSPGEFQRRLALPPASLEVTRRRKDGQEVVVLVSLSRVSPGHAFAFAETSLDVTPRRRLERELEHEKRLAAIGRIAASMAHEINNPLAVVRAANAYVAEVARANGDALLTETVEDVRLAAERIGSFVEHVCGFARRERPTLRELPLRETVRMAMRLAKPRAADRNVELVLEPGSDVRLPHDTPRMSQAILNLVANAVDAAADGGRHVAVRVVAEQGFVRVQVDDDGPGVPEDLRERVFEPFITTKPHGHGTGLGLSITRQIVDDHCGVATLGPRPDRAGTRAEIVLPLARRAASTWPARPPLPTG